MDKTVEKGENDQMCQVLLVRMKRDEKECVCVCNQITLLTETNTAL